MTRTKSSILATKMVTKCLFFRYTISLLFPVCCFSAAVAILHTGRTSTVRCLVSSLRTSYLQTAVLEETNAITDAPGLLLYSLWLTSNMQLIVMIHNLLPPGLLALRNPCLTLILLTWRIGWTPNNASRWQMGFNLASKWLKKYNH